MEQIANSFDKASLIKIGKGCLIALGGTLLTYLASNVGAIQEAFAANPVLAAVIGALGSIAINAAKEYLKGK